MREKLHHMSHLAIAFVVAFMPLIASAQGEKKSLPMANLQPFEAIRVESGMELNLVEVTKSDNLRITYDLSDNDPEKFKFEVKNEVLYITQPRNEKSSSPIVATLYYSGLKRIHAARATLNITQKFSANIADIKLEDGASLMGELVCDDVEISAFTSSRLQITGDIRYLTLKISSSAKAELRELNTMSANINASNGAVVSIKTGERLDVTASTSSVVKYWGEPQIKRMRSSLIGGQVLKQQ